MADDVAKRPPFISLSGMMLLQYAVWGVWLPYLASYLGADPVLSEAGERIGGGLGFTGAQTGWILGIAASLGAMSAPFIAGQLADRFLNAERALGILLILGGIVQFITFYMESFAGFMSLSILYSVLYMPTLALTNSIAFAHLPNSEKQFPVVRTWGTIGWILASNAFPLIWLQSNLSFTALPPFLEGTNKPDQAGLIADAMRVSGSVAVLYGLWAIACLPKTPPTKTVEHPLAFMRAFKLLKDRGFLVVTLAALPISMIHQVYFIRTSPFLEAIGFQTKYAGPIMSIGQVSEIFFLALLGLFLKRLGYKWILTLGAMAYFVRFGIFAIAGPEANWLVPAANTMHGLCYGFFFAGAFLYVEKVAPKDIRHSAQTVFAIVILGLGPILAGFYNQFLDTLTAAEGGLAWPRIWSVQSGMGLISAVLLVLAFREGRRDLDPDAASN
ncbi:MAG: MFS transporter [Planctomycetota bacterium]